MCRPFWKRHHWTRHRLVKIPQVTGGNRIAVEVKCSRCEKIKRRFWN